MKKITIFSRLMLIAILIANPAVIMPMEPDLENAQDNAVQSEESCTLCLNDGPATDFRQLGCGHRFCVECLKDLLRLGLDEEWAQAMAVHLHCPKRGCNYQMNEDDVQTISGDPARVAHYFDILTRLFINANRNFRRCPMANCEAVYEFGPNAQTITCPGSCQARYCSHCRKPHSQGEPCQEAGAPMQNNNNASNSNLTAEQEQEQQYQTWLRQNTKQCPQCRVNIQKNDGCNHMTCRRCRHEFCWQCLAHWRNPGQNGYNEFAQTHQGFYRCNAGMEQVQAQAIAAPQQPQELRVGQFIGDNEAVEGNLIVDGIIHAQPQHNAHAEGFDARAQRDPFRREDGEGTLLVPEEGINAQPQHNAHAPQRPPAIPARPQNQLELPDADYQFIEDGEDGEGYIRVNNARAWFALERAIGDNETVVGDFQRDGTIHIRGITRAQLQHIIQNDQARQQRRLTRHQRWLTEEELDVFPEDIRQAIREEAAREAAQRNQNRE